MKNKIIFTILLIFIFLLAGLFIYINNVFLPVKVRAFLVRRLSDYTEKDVEIQRVKYDLLKGLVIENITIFDKTKDEENLYLQVSQVSGNLLILPIFKEKKIIIPILRIDSSKIYLTRRKDKTLNLSELFKKKSVLQQKMRYQFLPYKIIISNAKCLFRDRTMEPAYKRQFVDLKIGTEIDLPSKLNFLIEGKIPYVDIEQASTLNLSGIYDLPTKQLQSNVKLAKIPINEYLPYTEGLPFLLSGGFIDSADLEILMSKNKQISLKGKLATRNLELKKEKLALKGNIDIEPDLKYNLDEKKLSYKANFKLKGGNLSGLDYLKEMQDIDGDLILEENKIRSDNLIATAYGSPLEIKGVLEDFSNPYIRLNVSSVQLNLEKFTSLIPSKPEDLILTGESTLNMEIKGLLNNPPLEINSTSIISSAKLNLPYLKDPLNEIKGKIGLSNNKFIWENISFLYKDTSYTSSGSVAEFKQPRVDFSLISKELTLNTKFNIKDKIIGIDNCSGKYLDSDFTLRGNIDTKIAGNPLLDIDVKSNISAKDIVGLLPTKLKENLDKLKLEGMYKVNGALNGKIKDIKDWRLALNISSPLFSVSGLKLENLRLKLNQKNKVFWIKPLSASAYAGNLDLTANSNLEAESPLYHIKASFSDIDLAKLKMDTKLKDKDISGLLNLQTEFQTNAKELDSLKGAGFISVTDGRLWHLDLFKGLGEFLLLPLYDKIVFKKAGGNFIIGNKTIQTNDTILKSEIMNLLCQGKAGFDGSLDFVFTSEINEQLINESPDLRKFTSVIVGNMLTMKVSGTIQKPEFKTFIPAKEIIKGFRRFFLGR